MEELGLEGLDDLVFFLKDIFLKVNYLYIFCFCFFGRVLVWVVFFNVNFNVFLSCIKYEFFCRVWIMCVF